MRAAQSQSAKVRVPGRPIKAWLVIGATVVAALLVLAALVGAHPKANQPVDVLPVVGSSIEETLRRLAVSAFLAMTLLVLLTAAVRGCRLRWLAITPGPVDVANLLTAGALPEGLADRLTLRFRQRMAELHLTTPGPQPGIAPATDFVNLIGSATSESQNVFAMVVNLLRVAWPNGAYQVQATLVHDDERGCGVSVQVVMLPAITTPPTTCWAPSWEVAIDRAANCAAALILPRTRVIRASPWAAWQGYVLPPALLDAYENAAVCTHQRRYDEALREYYTALELDPKNLEIRLRIGFIQEKLGLALDALVTYQAMCDMTCDGSMPGVQRTAVRSVLSVRRRRHTIGAYRRAVLLGSADLSRQWCAPDDAGDGAHRDAQRRACRERLRPALMELCSPHWAQTEASGRTTLEELLADGAEIQRREVLVCEVFQRAALAALATLRDNLPREVTGTDERSLTRPAVMLSERCVQMRLRDTCRALAPAARHQPLTLSDLRDWVRSAGLGRNAPWAERYSAASLYALGISSAGDAEATELADEAVAHLERAIENADSGYVASRRAWIVSEDPALDDLRATRRFQRFEANYFPSRIPTTLRPPGAHGWEVVEYVRRLVAACARHREEVWRAPVAPTTTDGGPDRLASAWHDELQAWELVSEVASNCEHWQTRLKLVEALQAWMTGQTVASAPTGYPEYADGAPGGGALSAAIDDIRARLAAAHALAELQRADLDGSAGGAVPMAPPDADGDAQLCHERVAAWRLLIDKLESSPTRRGARSAGDGHAAAHVANSGARGAASRSV